MTEILKEWLTHRLQVSDWDAEELGDKMKNGYTVGCLLHNYNIINDEKKYLIRSSNAYGDIINNWKLIKEWLREIDIGLTDDDLKNIMQGKGSSIVRLFYQLFLILDKKDRSDFIKKERKMASKLVEKMGNRFSVQKVYEEPESKADDLSKPLLNEKHFIDWQRKKSEQVKEIYDYIRHKYKKMLYKSEESQKPIEPGGQKAKKFTDHDKNDIEKFSLKYPCKFENYSYDELVALDEKAMNMNSYIADSEWSKEYIKNVNRRIHKKADSEEFQKQMTHDISESLWHSSVAENESALDLDLAKKVMKLSQFEKQMCTQIMETKQQALNLINNRIIAEKGFTDERTCQFNIFLDSVKEDINTGLSEIDFEHQRQQMLHKKLYAEKMKRKRQHYYEICYDTVLSIVDFATKYGYYKRLLGDDIPENFIHEWKLLYYKQQPIFDILTPIDDLVIVQEEENETKVEEVLDLKEEKNRQECLNECEFFEYHNYENLWSLHFLIPNYDPESEERKFECLGNKILGHVVYTLLELKYPYPPKRIIVDLPEFDTKALLIGIPNIAIVEAMQKLLDAQKVQVIRIESCVNFCLKQFKSEMVGCTDIELTFDKFINNAKDENVKELVKHMKSYDELHSQNSESLTPPLNNNTKQTQTPKTIPEDQIILSDAASLGKYAYETLSLGDALTDYLIAAMIVEFIKDQKDINGFVIINYPNNYREAQVLEETFTGKGPPNEQDIAVDDDIYLEESIKNHYIRKSDPLQEKRKSKLVGNPHKKEDEKPFTSYFTCYIKLKKTENILDEFLIWDLTKENSEFIERFYSSLGINYSMYYEDIEKEQLALITKYIIGDYEMPLKSDDLLFGANVLSNLDFSNSEDKRTRSKAIKPEVDSKHKYKVRRNSKVSKTSDSTNMDASNVIHSKVELDHNNLSGISPLKFSSHSHDRVRVSKIKSEELLAGDDDWEYSKLCISEKIGISLATYWEEIEKGYIHDIQQLLFSKRLQINCLVPYTTFVKDKIDRIISLPSSKQDFVSKFQRDYNSYEDDWRDINETKSEWHCRIKDLQNRLYDICDERKKYAEQQKNSLICENWILDELVTLANSYISFMQTEMNRFVLTYQLLLDLYFMVLKGSPPHDRLVSKDLNKVLKEADETSVSRKGGEDKMYRQLKNLFIDQQLRNINIDNSNNPLNMVIENNVKFVLKTIKDLNDSYRSLISRECAEIAKTAPMTKKKEDNGSANSNNSLEIAKMNALKCIDEWTMGINGEMFRANLRISVLQNKYYQDMKLFCNSIYKAFTDIQDNINNYYTNEITAVNRLCKYLQMAVETSRKISENLLLKDDTFVIDPNLLHFPVQNNETPKRTEEQSNNVDFKMGQLAKLRSTFKILAPTGIALQQLFIYALQDFICFGKESCDGAILPALWRRIDPNRIPKLVLLMFGENAFIDWRDFLIYCLNIRFPTIDELLETRKIFRCVDAEFKELISRDDYMNIELWFEKDLELDNQVIKLRNALRRHFLFELFETGENVMNYSAFLLAFCKSIDPKEGFSKALSMAIGKKICYLLEDCKSVIQNLIEAKKLRDERRNHAFDCAKIVIDTIITKVIAICESTTIIELENVQLPDKEKKGRKSKGSAKTKKNDNSARIQKSQKNLISTTKIVQSETDVKTLFECKTCDVELDTTQEKVPEKEEIKVEQKEEPIQDPNLVYNVQQQIIWNILNTCLPWHFILSPEYKETHYKSQIEDLLLQLEHDTDDKSIYICKFLSDPDVCKFLHKTKRFVKINLYEELLSILAE